MRHKLLWVALVITLFILLFPGSAVGVGPYGYGYPYPATPDTPWAHPGPERGDIGMARPTRLRIERGGDANNYYVTIQGANLAPEAVTINLEGGRWLAIGTGEADTTHQEDIAPDRSAYYRSFSYSSSNRARRISLPRDADVGAIRRENTGNGVRIVIPRLR